MGEAGAGVSPLQHPQGRFAETGDRTEAGPGKGAAAGLLSAKPFTIAEMTQVGRSRVAGTGRDPYGSGPAPMDR